MDREIKYNLVNSAIAGGLIFLGSLLPLLTGDFDFKAICLGATAGIITGLIVFLNKFKEYWDSEAPEYCDALNNQKKLFNFL